MECKIGSVVIKAPRAVAIPYLSSNDEAAGPSRVVPLCELPQKFPALLGSSSSSSQIDSKAVLTSKDLGTSTLCIAESHLTWSNGSGLGFSMDYPIISLHVVSRDLNAYPQEHLYVWVNAKYGEESKESVEGGGGGEVREEKGGREEGSDDDIEPIAQFRFVLSGKPTLEAIFAAALWECQALHPDPEDEDSDDYHGEEYDLEAHEGIEVSTAPAVAGQFEYAAVDL
ncbi:methylosome subunit pICln-like [Hyaena hyaena]|uniref:methylosome subunit pICln-like n=1 Tax=Hyaena hyaena TaxID=95912 RepID=UPI001922F94C|nr:methylosome subunit pICln-like [Hyaena hyaena]